MDPDPILETPGVWVYTMDGTPVTNTQGTIHANTETLTLSAAPSYHPVKKFFPYLKQ